MPILGSYNPGLGIAVVRVAFAIVVLGQAVLAWFITGMPASVTLFATVGAPIPEISTYIVRTCELIGGTMVLLGFRSRWVGLWFIFEFIFTFIQVKLLRGGWDPARLDFMMLAAAIMLVLAGSGALSLDNALARRSRDATATPDRAVA